MCHEEKRNIKKRELTDFINLIDEIKAIII